MRPRSEPVAGGTLGNGRDADLLVAARKRYGGACVRAVLDEFEELLDGKNVTIPSSDREGREEEARLYGSEYYNLEDAITAILVEETEGRGSDLGRPSHQRRVPTL